MPLEFPLSPAVGDEYQSGGSSWVWNDKSVWERGAAPLTLISLVPDTMFFGMDFDQPVQINGTGFRSGNTVYLDGVAIPATYVSDTEFTAEINSLNETATRDAAIRVGSSNELPFHFTGATTAPIFQDIDPTSAWNNWNSVDITCYGSAFHPAAKALWDGVEQANTVYLSPNSIMFNIDATVEALGIHQVGATNGAGLVAGLTCVFTISY
jgi:hypothetical protein